MGFDGALDGWKRTKVGYAEKNCGYRGYREDCTAGVWRGQGLFMVRHLETAVCFAIMWGWQNGGGWWIFWKNAKKKGESVEFFLYFL